MYQITRYGKQMALQINSDCLLFGLFYIYESYPVKPCAIFFYISTISVQEHVSLIINLDSELL